MAGDIDFTGRPNIDISGTMIGNSIAAFLGLHKWGYSDETLNNSMSYNNLMHYYSPHWDINLIQQDFVVSSHEITPDKNPIPDEGLIFHIGISKDYKKHQYKAYVPDNTIFREVENLMGTLGQQTYTVTQFQQLLDSDDYVIITNLLWMKRVNKYPRPLFFDELNTYSKPINSSSQLEAMGVWGWGTVTKGSYPNQTEEPRNVVVPLRYMFGCGHTAGMNVNKGSQSGSGVGTRMSKVMPKTLNFRVFTPGDGNTVSLNIIKKSELVFLLNNFGIPYTFDLNEAYNVPESEFTDWTPPTTPDPEEPVGGGDGDRDNTTDDITISAPAQSPLNTVNTSYAVQQDTIKDLSKWLWSADYWNTADFKMLFNEPAEALISVVMYPFDLDNNNLGVFSQIYLGNIPVTSPNSTAVALLGRVIPQNYNCVFDMGSFKVNEYFGSFLDYSPHTTIDIYLPYLGFRNISVNEVMKRTISVKYAVDVLTGACMVMIWADGQMLYSFSGSIGVSIPLSNTNANQQSKEMIMGIAQAGIGIGGAAMTMGLAGAASPVFAAGLAGGTVSNLAGKAVSNAQNHIQRGGQVSAFSSLFAPQYCYLVIRRPVDIVPNNYSSLIGFPASHSGNLGGVSGYVEVREIQLDTIKSTNDEKNELKKILQEGVIIR